MAVEERSFLPEQEAVAAVGGAEASRAVVKVKEVLPTSVLVEAVAAGAAADTMGSSAAMVPAERSSCAVLAAAAVAAAAAAAIKLAVVRSP